METVKALETVIKGLVGSKKVDLGKEQEECVVESGCIDPCKVSGFGPVDSSSCRDVDIKGISLFVELTGGVTKKRDCEAICDVGQDEFRVNVGDLVWVVIRKPNKSSWWPAVVCDGSDAPKEAENGPAREDDCLVRCFGNGSYIWCSACEVKPFVGYFDQLPSRSIAKKFLDALGMAVVELGHRVKNEFTCSCFCKMKREKAGNFGGLSVTRFEPAKFLDYIKDLARVTSVPNKIDRVVKQNCLSAFYRSLGHLEIPMNQLTLTFRSPSEVKTEEENGYFNDDFEKSEKPFETRERTNRFLSYPGECRFQGSMVDVDERVDLNESNGQSQPVKKPRKKWSKKSKGVQANICSSKVLSQLQLAAQDCHFPCESKNFDLVERFISELRKQAFSEFSNEIPVKMLNGQNLKETIPKKVKRKKEKSIISPTLGKDSIFGSLITAFQSLNLEAQSMANKRTESPANQSTFCNIAPKRPKKNAENNTSMHYWNADISTLPIVNRHIGGLYQAPVPHFTNAFWSTAPCITQNHCEPQASLGPAGLGHVPKKRGRKKKNIDLQANPGSTIFHDFTANHGEPNVGLVPSGLSHVPKKRGRKRKNFDLQANPGSTIIPNSNENGTERKTEKKLKIKEVGVPCIDLCYKKVQQDNVEEVKGTAFLLKFSPDHPLPTNQDLNSVFSKYGELIESETQALNENLSGQVVFLDSSSAGGAFWGLQNDKPFGPVLVNYKIQHLSGAESMAEFKTPIRSPSGLKPTNSQPLNGSTMTPNRNTNSAEIQITKRSKTVEEIRLPSMDNLSYSKVHQSNGEVTGTALLLKFSPNHPLPSFQDLNSIFRKYGELNEFETHVSGQDFTGQVVFVNPSTAGDAIHRLEKDRPFGQALLSYRVDHLYTVQSAIRVKSPVTIPIKLKPCQDLEGIKKNLEMMNVMLEKAGDGLSLEMRGKLEREIKGLMKKVSVMNGCSSSTSSCL